VAAQLIKLSVRIRYHRDGMAFDAWRVGRLSNSEHCCAR
jgi:hypothetical protein